MKSRILMLALLAALPLGLRAQAPPEAKVSVSAALDRTAVWVGDRVHYTLEFICPEDLDILLEDLSKERLPVEGAEVLALDAFEESSPQGRIRRLRYTLTTHAVDRAEIAIGSFPVRYFSRRTIGSGTQTAPAGEVTVPPAIVAIRSTLPDRGRLPELRQPPSLRLVPRYVRWVQPLGLLLIALAIVPVALMVLNVAGGLRRLRAAAPRLQARWQRASALDDLVALRPASDEARLAAFARLDQLVREHLQLTAGISALALTPSEIAGALRERSGSWPADRIESILATCERARYAPDPSSPEDWDAAVAAATHVVRRRAA